MSSVGQRKVPGGGRGDQVQLKMPVTNQDPQGGVQTSSPYITDLLAELTGTENTIQAGRLGMTQPKIDSITAAIQGTTIPVATFALTPGQQQVNDIIDCSNTTRAKLYEKAPAALKLVFDHTGGCTVIF